MFTFFKTCKIIIFRNTAGDIIPFDARSRKLICRNITKIVYNVAKERSWFCLFLATETGLGIIETKVEARHGHMTMTSLAMMKHE